MTSLKLYIRAVKKLFQCVKIKSNIKQENLLIYFINIIILCNKQNIMFINTLSVEIYKKKKHDTALPVYTYIYVYSVTLSFCYFHITRKINVFLTLTA